MIQDVFRIICADYDIDHEKRISRFMLEMPWFRRRKDRMKK